MIPRMSRPTIVITFMDAKMNSASPYTPVTDSSQLLSFDRRVAWQITCAEKVYDDDNYHTHCDPNSAVYVLVPV